eukprot:XP_001691716.1 predicted protein [Chlamydomonas reinhardtii]
MNLEARGACTASLDITTTSSKNNDSSSHSSTSGTRPTASAAPPTQQMTDFVEVALTPEELPPGPLREALKRTLAISAGTLPLRDMRRLLQEHYARYAVYETNLLWCPHSTALAAWLGAAHVLLMPYVEGIRCHRVVLRRVAAAAPEAAASAAESYPPPAAAAEAATAEHPPSAAAAASTAIKGAAQTLRQRRREGREGERGDVPYRTMQLDVAFSWRPLAPLHTLLAGWTGGLAGSSTRSATGSSSALRPSSGGGFTLLPLFTTEHTITLSINAHDRVVAHRDITHNFPLAPRAAKGLLGLPTPLVATLLHV